MANMNKYIVSLLLYCGLLTWSSCEESYPSAPKKTAEIGWAFTCILCRGLKPIRAMARSGAIIGQ